MSLDPHIDSLLARYLALLDTYTTLTTSLSTSQSQTFQHIARANWAAPRGVRYGQDLYDERMQAIRRVEIEESDGIPEVKIVDIPLPEPAPQLKEDPEIQNLASASGSLPESTPKIDPRNPLRWFGLLTPTPLKAAQATATTSLTDIVPALINMRFRLKQLEIDIGRARKQRAKVLKAETEASKGIEKTGLVT